MRTPFSCRMPSPQTLRWQLLQSSLGSSLPSSHSSIALPWSSLSMLPSPHPVPPWQSSLHPPGLPPSSHFSLTSLIPLPHTSVDLQSAEQPSPLTVLPFTLCSGPSSQTSPTSTMPLPQTSTDLQSAEQPSPLVVLPLSQISPGSMSPLPHSSRVQ